MEFTKVALSVCALALCSVPALSQTKDINSADRAFLRTAADTNMTQAHVGQMAEQQASQNSVKEFGQKLVQDHTNAYGELAALAQRAGQSIPKGIDVRKYRSIEQLTRLKGAQFDHQFVRAEIQDSERTIASFKHEAQDGHDAYLKAYATKMLPVLQDHLHTAEKLAKPEKHS